MTPPKVATTTLSGMKKQRIVRYIPPRKLTTKLVRLQKEAKYELVEPEIPPGVIIEEDMLGIMENLKYANHDLSNEKKFLELALKKYLKTIIFP
jgi:hypothetical protein